MNLELRLLTRSRTNILRSSPSLAPPVVDHIPSRLCLPRFGYYPALLSKCLSFSSPFVRLQTPEANRGPLITPHRSVKNPQRRRHGRREDPVERVVPSLFSRDVHDGSSCHRVQCPQTRRRGGGILCYFDTLLNQMI